MGLTAITEPFLHNSILLLFFNVLINVFLYHNKKDSQKVWKLVSGK